MMRTVLLAACACSPHSPAVPEPWACHLAEMEIDPEPLDGTWTDEAFLLRRAYPYDRWEIPLLLRSPISEVRLDSRLTIHGSDAEILDLTYVAIDGWDPASCTGFVYLRIEVVPPVCDFDGRRATLETTAGPVFAETGTALTPLEGTVTLDRDIRDTCR